MEIRDIINQLKKDFGPAPKPTRWTSHCYAMHSDDRPDVVLGVFWAEVSKVVDSRKKDIYEVSNFVLKDGLAINIQEAAREPWSAGNGHLSYRPAQQVCTKTIDVINLMEEFERTCAGRNLQELPVDRPDVNRPLLPHYSSLIKS